MNSESTDGVSILIKQKWKILLAVIIFLVSVLFFIIIVPLLDGIILGIVLAYVARPMKTYLDRYIPRASPYIATFAIVFPIFLIIGLGIIEIFNELIWLAKNYNYAVNTLLDLIESMNLPVFVEEKTKDVIINFTSYLLPVIRQLPVSAIARSFTMFILNTLISVVLCFSLLVDGASLVERIMDIVPEEVNEFSQRFEKHLDGILSAIFIGNTYSAIAVGVLSLIVFSAFKLTNVLALSALMLIAALVPLFAGYMVIVPVSIYRYFALGSQEALVFFVVCVLVIMIPPELLIRPYIIHTKSNIHPMLIIIAFIGGGLVGGIAGFFIAPMLLGAIIAAYRTVVGMRTEKI